MDINVKIPALEKLMDYTASGIGSTAGFLFSTWVAKRVATAKVIAAEGDAEQERILAEGRASALIAIANAQAEAKSVLVSESSDAHIELEIPELITQRIQYQEKKRQANITSVVRKAGEQLGDKEVDDHDVDHDWTARFFTDVQDVSSEEMQHLWARVLAGEVQKPKSVSMRTLQVLRNMDTETATLFRRLCSLSLIVVNEDHKIVEARVPTLERAAGGNSLLEFGLHFGLLNRLNEHGLIIADYDSYLNYDMSISLWPGVDPGDIEWIFPFMFSAQHWILEPTKQRPPRQKFEVNGVAMTNTGMELSRIVETEPVPEYAQALRQYFERNHLRMVQVDSPEPIRI